MKRSIFIILFYLLFLTSSVTGNDSLYKKDTADDSLYIKSLDAFHFENRLNPPVLRLQLTFYNRTNRKLRIKDGDFEIFINPNNMGYKGFEDSPTDSLGQMDRELFGGDLEMMNRLTRKLSIGKTKIAVGNAPASNCTATNIQYIEILSHSAATKIIEVNLPKSLEERIQTIYLMMNYLGLPKSSKIFLLDGKATLGQNDLKKGGHIYKMSV